MAGDTDSRADSKGRRGTREVLEWARGGILKTLLIDILWRCTRGGGDILT